MLYLVHLTRANVIGVYLQFFEAVMLTMVEELYCTSHITQKLK